MSRGDLGSAIGALIADLGAAVPEAFGPVDARRILVVVGAARREARASIRPLTFGGGRYASADGAWDKPRVVVGGALVLYEITLRPLFFRATAPAARILTLAHELWHAGPYFDGTLPAERSHVAVRGEPVESAVKQAVAAWRARSPRAAALEHALTVPGEHLALAWLRRPPSRIPRSSALRRSYDDEDLYPTVVELLAPESER